jgi:hypothetical protein
VVGNLPIFVREVLGGVVVLPGIKIITTVCLEPILEGFDLRCRIIGTIVSRWRMPVESHVCDGVSENNVRQKESSVYQYRGNRRRWAEATVPAKTCAAKEKIK